MKRTAEPSNETITGTQVPAQRAPEPAPVFDTPPVTSGDQSEASTPRHRQPWYRQHWVHLVSVGVLGLAVGGAVAGGNDAPAAKISSKSAAAAADAAAAKVVAERDAAAAEAKARASALAEAEAAAAPAPAPAAFRLTVKVLQKHCFGSAGCNVTFRVVPTFVGPGDPNSTEVTYEVVGGEDGPQVDTFTIDSAGTASYDSEDQVSKAVVEHTPHSTRD